MIFINTTPIFPQLLTFRTIAVLAITLMKVNSKLRSMLSFTTQPITLGSRMNNVIIKTTNFRSIFHIIQSKKRNTKKHKYFSSILYRMGSICLLPQSAHAIYRWHRKSYLSFQLKVVKHQSNFYYVFLNCQLYNQNLYNQETISPLQLLYSTLSIADKLNNLWQDESQNKTRHLSINLENLIAWKWTTKISFHDSFRRFLFNLENHMKRIATWFLKKIKNYLGK